MATPHKAPTIRPPASHHENYPSYTEQTHRTLLEKQGRSHKWCTPMGPPDMAEQKQDDQLEHIYSSYVRIWDIALKNLPEAMNDREKWQERVRDIHASGMTWWWWWYIIIIIIKLSWQLWVLWLKRKFPSSTPYKCSTRDI